jgi:hypothetical protein
MTVEMFAYINCSDGSSSHACVHLFQCAFSAKSAWHLKKHCLNDVQPKCKAETTRSTSEKEPTIETAVNK